MQRKQPEVLFATTPQQPAPWHFEAVKTIHRLVEEKFPDQRYPKREVSVRIEPGRYPGQLTAEVTIEEEQSTRTVLVDAWYRVAALEEVAQMYHAAQVDLATAQRHLRLVAETLRLARAEVEEEISETSMSNEQYTSMLGSGFEPADPRRELRAKLADAPEPPEGCAVCGDTRDNPDGWECLGCGTI